ncbi:methyl-accepting chemotaxis protein [Sphingomonas desiccabilis]|uniref:Methyl-accepting chemotaxis protein n=1 Tax=Sphingomonas desiccabilis TaxID=429134 RepID=A0A4Q2IYV9_9SPHN|nr:methyl-accepting chemotaxis protein [Sphingomonas desiccabilis]MBB3909834.1 methyl-accepting chemotaxis protein [Sphingomonas desiccabilis]RXZ34513.1 methyl-accepting chemotaxis protein [Sphingomonas desiccabilis]
MSVSTRIVAGFGIITAILVALGLYSLQQVGVVRSNVDRIVQRDYAAILEVDEIARAEARMREARLMAVMHAMRSGRGAPSDIADWQARANGTAAALAKLTATAEKNRETAINQGRIEQWRQLSEGAQAVQASFDRLRPASARQLEMLESGNIDGAVEAGEEIDRHHAALAQSLAQVRTIVSNTIEVGRRATQDVYESTRTSILIGLLIAIAISVVVAFTIRRSITGPLNDFMSFAGRIGEGDLSGETRITGADELGQLGVTLNTMVVGLREIARQSRAATEDLNAAATEIRASTQEQAASVEEQLAAVQETAATVDEITHSGAQITLRAQEVIAAAQATAQTSDTGRTAVHDTARAMDAIREQAEAVAGNIVALSEKTQTIGDIIATVNDVSERSHLLALNASIEAAAAGEQGRSFAIVAAEMKTLADQAKSATRNVRSILGDIQRGINASVMLTEEAVKRVASGKERTDASQSAINELATRVQENVHTFQQIVASTNQQQIGIEQVTIALQNIRQASQQTAASTRQLDQAAGDLTQLSRTLVGLTERYRV